MKKIPLRNRKGEVIEFSLIDDDDFERLNKYKWHVFKSIDGKRKYAQRTFRMGKKQIHILMHREVLKIEKGKFGDHIDGNGLNNQKQNLRVCNNSQNQMNCRRQGKYKGVYRTRNLKMWRAAIKKDQKSMHIGTFDNERNAAIAYNNVAIEIFGKFALLNNV